MTLVPARPHARSSDLPLILSPPPPQPLFTAPFTQESQSVSGVLFLNNSLPWCRPELLQLQSSAENCLLGEERPARPPAGEGQVGAEPTPCLRTVVPTARLCGLLPAHPLTQAQLQRQAALCSSASQRGTPSPRCLERAPPDLLQAVPLPVGERPTQTVGTRPGPRHCSLWLWVRASPGKAGGPAIPSAAWSLPPRASCALLASGGGGAATRIGFL